MKVPLPSRGKCRLAQRGNGLADSQPGHTVINKKALQLIDWDQLYTWLVFFMPFDDPAFCPLGLDRSHPSH